MTKMEKTVDIYVLRLEGDNWYVGSSENIEERYKHHLSGKGSVWTKQHPPIKIEEHYRNCSPFDEDSITRKYMAAYGIEKVRGGSYVTKVLSEETIAVLQKEIWSAQGDCTRCGRKGHFVAKCYAKTDINDKSLATAPCTRCGRDGHSTEDCEYKTTIDKKKIVDFATSPKLHCARCGRDGHSTEDCEYKTTIDKKKIVDFATSSKLHCTRCGRDGHSTEDCEYKTTIDKKKIVDFTTSPKLHCTRCGRDTHTTDNCRCKTNVNGEYLDQGELISHCTRCGRDTHTVDKCYAKITVSGEKIA